MSHLIDHILQEVFLLLPVREHLLENDKDHGGDFVSLDVDMRSSL